MSRRPYGRAMASSPAHLSDERVTELLRLVTDADDVELKVTVRDTGRFAVLEALDVDPLEAQIRQVFFFDTPDLDLDQAGVVVRARRVQGRGDDTVIKLRPVVPQELAPELRRLPEFVVEVDAMPTGSVCSASLKGTPTRATVRDVVAGRAPVRHIFTKAQRSYFADHAPEGLGLDDLQVLGPIHVLKLKYTPTELARKVVGEMWLYPDGSRIVELSTKCSIAEPFQVAAECRAFLGSKGIDTGGDQHTKTRAALDFFARELREAAGAG
jgi:hypothetical protein